MTTNLRIYITCWADMFEGGCRGQPQRVLQFSDELPAVESIAEVDEAWGAIHHCAVKQKSKHLSLLSLISVALKPLTMIPYTYIIAWERENQIFDPRNVVFKNPSNFFTSRLQWVYPLRET